MTYYMKTILFSIIFMVCITLGTAHAQYADITVANDAGESFTYSGNPNPTEAGSAASKTADFMQDIAAHAGFEEINVSSSSHDLNDIELYGMSKHEQSLIESTGSKCATCEQLRDANTERLNDLINTGEVTSARDDTESFYDEFYSNSENQKQMISDANYNSKYGANGLAIKDGGETKLSSEATDDASIIAAFFNSMAKTVRFILMGGSPLAFAMDGDVCTEMRDPSFNDNDQWTFDLMGNYIFSYMDRVLCDNTYMLFFDTGYTLVDAKTGDDVVIGYMDGEFNAGLEAGFNPDGVVYESFQNSVIDSDNDGKLTKNDISWQFIKAYRGDGVVHTMEYLDIVEIRLDGYIALPDDFTGYRGQYVDGMYDGVLLEKPYDKDAHVRAVGMHTMLLGDGTVIPTYDIILAPMMHCSYQDYHYQYAELTTEDYRRTGEMKFRDKAVVLYEHVDEQCKSMGHGKMGLAGLEMIDNNYLEAKQLFDEAYLEMGCDLDDLMTCDHHWSLNDYGIIESEFGDKDKAMELFKHSNNLYEWEYTKSLMRQYG